MNKKITQFRWFAATLMLVAAMVMPSTAWAQSYDTNGFGSDESDPYQPATLTTDKYDIDGDGQKDNVYEIGNAGQLYWFAGLVNGTLSGVEKNLSANAVLTTDITVNKNVLKADGTPADDTSNFRNWTPIGNTFNTYYSGKFDGKGHTISGLYLINESTGYTYVGLFGVTKSGADISSLGVVDSYFAGASYVGGVCARHSGGTISNCFNAGSVYGLEKSLYVGGVCGNGGVLKHCYNRGMVSGSGSVGSLIGQAGNAIENCYYLEGTAAKGVGTDNVSASSNVIMKNAEQFKSGEVTYLLNQSTSSGTLAWYQNIEGDAKDDFPVLDSNHGTVYQVTDENNQTSYNNQASCQHAEYNNGICTSCGTFQEPEKSGEIYQIANYGNLLWFANEVNRGYTTINAELTCDITANDNLIDANGNVAEAPEYIWTPIGNATNIYSGKFDGNGHTISGLYVKSSTDTYVGLFGRVKNAEISNVGIVDSYFDAADYVGGICGYGDYVTITNCYNTGEVRSSGSECYVGGICGYGYGFTDSPVTITNCYNTGAVSGSGGYVGGVCGFTNSYSVISNCYYLVGMPAGSNTTAQTDMFECSISQFASGEVAYRLQGEQEGEVWGQTLTGDNRQYSPVLGGAKVYATTGCVTYNNSSDTSAKNHNKENGICKDCGAYDEATDTDSDGYYEIGNAGQLYWFAQQINSGNNNNINAVLTADITVNKGENTGDVANCNGTKADGWIDWVPIGHIATGYEYTGTFDGQNHTVSGLYFNDTSTSNVGLFGYNMGTIKNVGVVDSYFFNGNNAVGGVCGSNYGVNATITNCFNTGTVGGKTDVGGVCGNNNYGTIENCYNTGQVSGTTSIGGVCGYNCGGSTIKNCYNTGQVSGTTSIGGVCGYNDSYSTVKNCYYLTGTAENGVANNLGTATNVESKATDKFKSGEVVWLLNGKKSEGTAENPLAWYQNISGDTYPVLDSSHGTVYASAPCPSKFSNENNLAAEEHANEYTVSEEDKSISAKCSKCGIDRGTITITVGTTTYDGQPHAATVDGTIEGATTSVTYQTQDGSDLGTSAPTNAGTYKAILTCTDNEVVNTVSVDYTIEKADDVPNRPNNLDGCIGEKLSTVSLKASEGWSWDNPESTLPENAENIITAKASYSGEDKDNYTNIKEVDVTINLRSHNYSANGFCDYCCGYEPAQIVSDEHHQELNSTHEGYYAIENAGQLYWFAGMVNGSHDGVTQDASANAVLTEDITVNTGDIAGCNGVKGDGWIEWTPIGVLDSNTNKGYYGTFDGNNHTVSGLYFNDTNNANVGLFGYSSGTIQNVGVVNSYFNGNSSVGGVCGHNLEGTIQNCYNNSTVNGTQNIGGICGFNESCSQILNCHNVGVFNGTSDFGGVCGKNSGTITNCYYLANVEDNNGGKTEEQFNCGEVAYLLNEGKAFGSQVWGQQIGADDYPVLGSEYKLITTALKSEDGTYWATFSDLASDVTLSVPLTRTLKVYNATVSKGTMTLKERNDNQVAKEEGVLLKTDGEYVNVKANETDGLSKMDYDYNNLVATPATAQTVTADDGYTLYRLTYNNVGTKETLGFYLSLIKDSNDNVDEASIGKQLKAIPGKAYLNVKTSEAKLQLSAALARGFAFPGDDGETTGIECITVTDEGTGNNRVEGIFDLQGRKVSKPTKGVYINNGKKVIIK